MGEISEFWRWFYRHSSQMSRVKAEQSLLEEFEDELNKIGVEAWEIGPSDSGNGKSFLALSFDSDPSRIKLIDDIIDQAPEITNWEFLAGKPRKKWKRVFYWGNDRKQFDANDWKFIVAQYPDGMHEITLVYPAISGFEDNELLELIDFVVEAELGERMYLGGVYRTNFAFDRNDFGEDSVIDIERLRTIIERGLADRFTH